MSSKHNARASLSPVFLKKNTFSKIDHRLSYLDRSCQSITAPSPDAIDHHTSQIVDVLKIQRDFPRIAAVKEQCCF